MKKQYLKPEIEIIQLEQRGMLCISGGLGGEASGPAKSRMFDDDWDDWDNLYLE